LQFSLLKDYDNSKLIFPEHIFAGMARSHCSVVVFDIAIWRLTP
jgi:hypothetical protein